MVRQTSCQLRSALIRLVPLVVGAAWFTGCGSDPSPSKATTSPESPFRDYALTVFAKSPHGVTKVQLPPAHSLAGELLVDVARAAPGTSTKITIETGGETKDAVNVQGLTEPGWLLLMRAAAQCGVVRTSEPWSDPNNSWFLFDAHANGSNGTPSFPSCNDELAKEQQLLCTADRLKEIADAVAELTWPALPPVNQGGGSLPGSFPPWASAQWQIPVQSNRNKFIARDLALVVLANLVRLDMEQPIGLPPNLTCAETYARSTNLNVFNQYGTVLYGPNPDPNIRKEAAEFALRFNTQVLRAAGRMLRELIDDSVYADLAGAEQQRALAADTKRGPELLWGSRTDAEAPYNSLTHAFRVLFGRWETARPSAWGPALVPPNNAIQPSGDRKCGGYAPIELLTKALGPEMSARWQDKRVLNVGQERATQLLDASGILIPTVQLDAAPSFDAVRGAIKKQLVSSALNAPGSAPGTAMAAGRAAIIGQLIDEISPQDLRFALDRGFNAYRSVSLLGENPGPIVPAGALGLPRRDSAGVAFVPASVVASELTQLGGSVAVGGIPRADAGTDIMARLAGALGASQCPEFRPNGLREGSANVGKVGSFQNLFVLGDTIRRRLSAIRQVTETSFSPPAESQFPQLADVASAEMRTWTGPGNAWLRMVRVDGEPTIQVRLLGMTPADFGVQSDAEIKKKLVLVWGKPWVADCAAGLRSSCPENFAADYIQKPFSESVNGEIANLAGYVGNDDRAIALDFAFSGRPGFQPQRSAVGTPVEEHLFLVSLADPANAGRGKVLATFAARQGNDWYVESTSDYRRKLANDLFGFSKDWHGRGRGIGKDSSTSPPAYCIPGVPRDFFVPLENELTSDSDAFESSWKHYLLLAKASAQTTDTIGRELIEVGLQQDFRREAASEEVAKSCGEFGALEDTTVKDGIVEAPKDNSSLALCFDEPVHDVVLLTSLPPPGSNVDVLHNIVGCSGDDVKATNPLCSRPSPSIQGLGIAEYLDPDTASTPAPGACDRALALVASTDTSFDGTALKSVSQDPELSPDFIATVLAATRVGVLNNGDWIATLNNAPIMSTTDTNLWPACAATGCTDLNAKLDAIFGPAPSLDEHGKEALLQRVTGTIWLMAAVSGQLPAQAFTLPVPARDGFPNEPDGTTAPAPTLYGLGNFEPNGQLTTQTSAGGKITIADRDKMLFENQPATGIDSAYAQAVAASSARPQWVRDIYQSPGKYLHVRTSTSAIAFPDQPTILDFFSKRSDELNGVRFSGNACISSGAAAQQAIAETEKLKLPNQVGDVCTHGVNRVLRYYRTSAHIADGWYWRGTGKGTRNSDAFAQMDGKHWGNLWLNNKIPEELGIFFKPGTCIHARPTVGGVPTLVITKQCLADIGHPDPSNSYSTMTRSALSPMTCPPEDRARLFVNSATRYATPCDTAEELSRVLAFSCVLGNGYRALKPNGLLPEMAKPSDIVKLENWLTDQELNARKALSRLYLPDVPKRVVEDFQTGQVGSGALKGDYGQQVLQYRQHLSTLGNGWLDIEKHFKALRLAVTNARIGLVAADLNKNEKLKQLAMQEMQIQAQMYAAAAQAAGGLFGAFVPDAGGNPFEAIGNAAAAGIQAYYGDKQLSILEDLEAIADKSAANQVLGVLNTLNDTTNDRYTELQKTIEAMRIGVAGAQQTAIALRQAQNEAKYQAAKGTGADYVVLEPGGPVVPIPVNTVLRRQYDIAARRYKAALEESKRFAYFARLGIEQRIGQRLADMHQPIGSLAPPSTWADDVCNFQGVDYKALRTANLPDADGGLSEQPDYGEFADPYIGDYVQKLESLVEFYNIEYPSHEGDDTAVLSVRDDLLGPQGRCQRPSINLLHYSHALDRAQSTGESESTPVGWRQVGCFSNDAKCLQVQDGRVLQDQTVPLAGPGAAAGEGFTWLRDADAANVNTIEGATPPDLPDVVEPPGSVLQGVTLDAGAHTLSWFDRGWGTSATDSAVGTPVAYPVAVYDEDWNAVATITNTPDASGKWSDRRVVSFTPKAPGLHYVAFSASLAGPQLGSVVVANVQLERSAATGVASPYEATSSSRLILSGDCAKGSAQAFRNAFDYRCDAKACFYELREPFIIDTRLIDSAESKLIGKIAEGNYNFRHIQVALNVVGTGVLDCSKNPVPSCYGSGYLEYTLRHNAFATPVINYLAEAPEFNFGSAAINRGKALAAERFITLPIGSADQALLGQPQTTKNEYRGRPLSGSYNLRVYDSPSLVWNQVEDVQVVLTYRYWSRVQRESQQR